MEGNCDWPVVCVYVCVRGGGGERKRESLGEFVLRFYVLSSA